MSNIKKAFIRALTLFNEYTVIDDDFDGFIIAEDSSGNVNIIKVEAFFDDMPDYLRTSKSRNDFEHAAMKYLMSHDVENDVAVFFNIGEVYVIASDRAFVRHVVNWPNSTEALSAWSVLQIEEV